VKVRWEYACGRLSDRELQVRRKDKEVFSSLSSHVNTSLYGPQYLYRLYPEKVMTPEGKLLARVRPPLEGEVIPIKER